MKYSSLYHRQQHSREIQSANSRQIILILNMICDFFIIFQTRVTRSSTVLSFSMHVLKEYLNFL